VHDGYTEPLNACSAAGLLDVDLQLRENSIGVAWDWCEMGWKKCILVLSALSGTTSKNRLEKDLPESGSAARETDAHWRTSATERMKIPFTIVVLWD